MSWTLAVFYLQRPPRARIIAMLQPFTDGEGSDQTFCLALRGVHRRGLNAPRRTPVSQRHVLHTYLPVLEPASQALFAKQLTTLRFPVRAQSRSIFHHPSLKTPCIDQLCARCASHSGRARRRACHRGRKAASGGGGCDPGLHSAPTK